MKTSTWNIQQAANMFNHTSVFFVDVPMRLPLFADRRDICIYIYTTTVVYILLLVYASAYVVISTADQLCSLVRSSCDKSG